MKVKIYVLKPCYRVNERRPTILTEKQYEDIIQKQVDMRFEDLKNDDAFDDFLGTDYRLNEVFFLTEEEKKTIIEDYKPWAFGAERDDISSYYDEHEIEI